MKISRLQRKAIYAAILCGAFVVWALFQADDYCLRQAETHLQRRSWSSAESWLQRASFFSADAGRVQFLRSRMARKLGRISEFDEGLLTCQKLGVDMRLLERELWLFEAQTGKLDNLERNLSRLLVAGEDLQEICEAYAMGCIQHYRLEDAVNILALWSADFATDPQPHYLRGRLREHQSDIEGAEAAYRSALKLDPLHSAAAYNLGRLLLQNQHPAEAIAYFQVCAETLHEPFPGLVRIAQSHRELENYDLAESFLQRAEARPTAQIVEAFRLVGDNSESALAKLHVERGQLALAREQFQPAVDHFEDALEVNPFEWRIRYHLGTALRHLGHEQEAQAQIDQFNETKTSLAKCDTLIDKLKGTPDDVEARFQIGSVMLKYISPNQGLVWLNSAISYDPGHRPTHQLLAEYFDAHASENASFPELAKHHAALARQSTDSKTTRASLP